MGSTSYSSGICRTFYSVAESVKFAWESYHIWSNWQDFIRVEDERGLAHLRETGGLFLQTPSTSKFLATVLPVYDQVGIPYEVWDDETLRQWNRKFQLDLRYFAAKT